MDTFGDHALVCPCRGDRTTRHNALRDLTYIEADSARCCPEREKQGLLPGRPVDDGAPTGDAESLGDRQWRPADLFLPRGLRGPSRDPAALDWAVTSGLRADRVESSTRGPAELLGEYAEFKCSFKETERKCRDQGIRFVPLVIEAHGGGWGENLHQACHFIAGQQKAAGDWCREGTGQRLAQRISTALQRANAQAVLRRRPTASIDVESMLTVLE